MGAAVSAGTLGRHLETVVRSGLPGAVAAAAVPGLSWEGAAGLADVQSGAPLTPDHRFRVGSVMKLFTATVVLKLVEEGALALDQDAGPIAPGITIRQLLNHTSGLPDIIEDLAAFFEPYRQDPAHRWEIGPCELLALVHQKPRLFPPGEGWEYHGSNYLALGLLVEETTGATLREELKRRIFDPLELAATDLPPEPLAPGLARGYLLPDNELIPATDIVDATELDLPFNWAGGGVVSTGRDLARFLQALLGGELLAPHLRAEMLRTVPSDWEETDAYGLGIGKVSSLMGKVASPCGSAWGHIGFSPGYTAIALGSESGDRRVVVLANVVGLSDESWEALGRLVWAS